MTTPFETFLFSELRSAKVTGDLKPIKEILLLGFRRYPRDQMLEYLGAISDKDLREMGLTRSLFVESHWKDCNGFWRREGVAGLTVRVSLRYLDKLFKLEIFTYGDDEFSFEFGGGNCSAYVETTFDTFEDAKGYAELWLEDHFEAQRGFLSEPS